jgi:hypothetical protein
MANNAGIAKYTPRLQPAPTVHGALSAVEVPTSVVKVAAPVISFASNQIIVHSGSVARAQGNATSQVQLM